MKGYFRFPTIYKDQIVFVCEDNLWKVTINNLHATRLTANSAAVITPLFSPDGKYIAYVGREDGNTEVYIMPSNGGISKRLTYDGAFISKIASWDGDNIVYASDLNQHCMRICDLRKVKTLSNTMWSNEVYMIIWLTLKIIKTSFFHRIGGKRFVYR